MLIFFLACSQDKSININNNPPEVLITSHNNGDSIYAGRVVEFRAALSDNNDGFDDLEAQWSIGERLVCPFMPPDINGRSTCSAAFFEGESQIMIEVRDPANATAIHSINLSVEEALAPELQLIQPVDAQYYYSDQLITFEGDVFDIEDRPEDLTITWTSSIDGLLNVATVPNEDGMFVDFGYLSSGEHGITLNVENTAGKSASESIIITVLDSNDSPDCEILEPLNSSTSQFGETVLFTGFVQDSSLEPTQIRVEWHSDIDGLLRESIPDTNGQVSFATTDLSNNTHIVTMKAFDDGDNPCIASILHVVSTPPQVLINEPTDGASFGYTESIAFIAEITDTETPSMDIQVEWSSSIDGVFSTQSPDANGVAQFGVNSLSPGEHVITISATDAEGLTTEDIRTIQINSTPSQPNVSIGPNPAYTIDDLTANASGSIDPDGDPITYTYEWMLGGVTNYTGSILPATLTTKNEVWTLRVTPNDSTGPGTYGEFSLSISNSPPIVHTTAISPAIAYAQDSLICNSSSSDHDGDTVNEIYNWYINGVLQSVSGSVFSGIHQTGDVVTCRVTPFDGSEYGAHLEDTITIQDPPDADGDGFINIVYGGNDCDDSDAQIYPGADEKCSTAGVDDDCDGLTDESDAIDVTFWYYDGDVDGYGLLTSVLPACTIPSGYVTDSSDCDDGNVSINPGASETCDGVDNNCDGIIDENTALDVSTWYLDVDADGYGDLSQTTSTCTMPSGYSADSSDCDDTAAGINPGAGEYCDGIDNNCDGVVDENTAVNVPSWYEDTDGDGYGNPANTNITCTQPFGYVLDNSDCDDANAAIHPGQAELCSTIGIDDDCDGSAEESDAIDAITWYYDSDGDSYGLSNNTQIACNAPANYASGGGDCNDGNANINPSATEYCDGYDNNCDGVIDEDNSADVLTWYRDADGDGYGDLNTTDIDCYQPSGYQADDTDCDDSQQYANPGATEYCDGYDNNCDGVIDEDTAANATTWYEDADGDGYGNPNSTDVECNQPTGYITNATDCNDTDADDYPGAVEVCDGDDNDCDGRIDDNDNNVDLTTGSSWYLDGDGDGYGNPDSSVVKCDLPTGYVADNTDCDDTESGINPSITEIWYDGVDQDCDTNDCDSDEDGYDYSGGTYCDGWDCDDNDSSRYPGTNTWTVSQDGLGDYDTIQEAINIACTEDYIEVGPGTYVENLVWGKKHLNLLSTAGLGQTIIDGDFNGNSVVTMEGGSITGFTISNGLALYGGGIYSENGQWLELTDVDIVDNYTATNGGGIYISSTDDVNLTGVQISNNYTDNNTSGAVISNSSTVVFSDVSITDNDGGTAINCTTPSFHLYNSVLNNNSGGIGLYAKIASEIIAPGLIVTNHPSSYGVYVNLEGTADFSNTHFENNTGGLYLKGYNQTRYFKIDVDVSNSVFLSNTGMYSLYIDYLVYGDYNLNDLTFTSNNNSTTIRANGITAPSYYGPQHTNITANNLTFSNNTGHLSFSGTNVELNNVSISNNPGSSSLSASSVIDLTVSNLLYQNNVNGGVTLSSSATAQFDTLLVGNNQNVSTTFSLKDASLDDIEILNNTHASKAALEINGTTIEANNLLIQGNESAGLKVTSSGTADSLMFNNVSVVGNDGYGVQTSSNWIYRIGFINLISAFNGTYGVNNASSISIYTPLIQYSDIYDNGTSQYNGMSDQTGSDGNLSVDPQFVLYDPNVSASSWDLTLDTTSPLIDAGDPTIIESDGSTSDMGYYGGN